MTTIEQKDIGAYWQRADVRAAMLRNAMGEMTHWQDYDVYTVFCDIGRALVKQCVPTLIDIGAGACQYGSLWLAECGGRGYYAMNEDFVATPPNGAALLASCCYECAPEPMDAMRKLATYPNPLILHRLRFATPGRAGWLPEPSYCDCSVPRWFWDAKDLQAVFRGRKITNIHWPHAPHQYTWVIEAQEAPE